MTKIGILHPGEMGVSIAASAVNSGHQVSWASQGRSDKTHSRAEEHNLFDAKTISELCQINEISISVCPPQSAEDVATKDGS